MELFADRQVNAEYDVIGDVVACLMPFAEYDDFGDVITWGPPNVLGYLAPVPDHGMLEVDAWRTWYVKVWWQRYEHPWCFIHDFYVVHFEYIHRHWAKYCHPGQGLTDRISFKVEHWYWSIEGGWEYREYMKSLLHHC